MNTPRTDKALWHFNEAKGDVVSADFARELETELGKAVNVSSIRTDEAEGLSGQLKEAKIKIEKMRDALKAIHIMAQDYSIDSEKQRQLKAGHIASLSRQAHNPTIPVPTTAFPPMTTEVIIVFRNPRNGIVTVESREVKTHFDRAEQIRQAAHLIGCFSHHEVISCVARNEGYKGVTHSVISPEEVTARLAITRATL